MVGDGGEFAEIKINGNQVNIITEAQNYLTFLTRLPYRPPDAWAVGYEPSMGVGKIFHWNGRQLEVRPSSDYLDVALYAIAMVSASDGWVVGSGGTILRWNGTTWNSVDSPTDSSLLSIDMVSAMMVGRWGSTVPLCTGMEVHGAT